MGSYRLTADAKADLRRIYYAGLSAWGEVQADKYFNDFFERFKLLTERPLLYPAVDDLREGYRRSVCGADSIFCRIRGEDIEIVVIIGQQDLDNWLTTPIIQP